ncbi:DUF3137 domain-containing protein [Nitrosophilus labii]|uniref:DUF3137 domain-containing protein n=1 Tax=Nitrosophilus labii TaxID=2706014 RepID=UPI001657114E|nr:DUF3137 domain-containing protein [Nitrosophilus labii]
MNSFSSLLDLYYNDLDKYLEVFEGRRKKIAFRLKLFALSLFLVSLLFIFYLIKSNSSIDSIVAVAIIALSLYFFMQRLMTKSYKKEFKDKIVKKLISHIDKELKYTPDGAFPQSLYILSSLFPKRFDRYRGNDLVVGKIEGVSVIFSDIHTEYKTKDSKGKIHWHTIFKGLFFMADFNKNFYGKTLIYPDIAQKYMGFVGQFFQEILKKGELKLVKMDNPAFEKKFVVYSSDQIEARYILTPNLMEKIVKMKKTLDKSIYISFVNNHIFIAIEAIESFEPYIFRSLYDIGLIKDYIKVLRFTVGLVEELNLNKKLWSRL